MKHRIHITGASGSGTSTLGRALAAALDGEHLDTDDFFWRPGYPPYREPRPVSERLALLKPRLHDAPRWALSGSLASWGDPLLFYFERVVLLEAPTPLRLERLRRREEERYGAEALAPGGEMHEQSEAFLAWAARYDEGGLDVRSRAAHAAWLAKMPCPVLHLDGARPVDALVAAVLG